MNTLSANIPTTWIWRHLRLALPADWALLQFSRDVDRGRCAWADRYQYRFQLDWRVVPGAPDFERMVSDLASQLESQHADFTPERVRRGEWHGLAGHEDGRTVCRFGRYVEPAGCLLEAVFIRPDAVDAGCEEGILASFGHEAPVDGMAHWRAYGMDIRVNEGLALEECRVRPADVEMVFTGARYHRVSFNRRGMVKQWLNEPIAQWLQRQLPADARDIRCDENERAGHRITTINARTRRPGVWGPMLRPLQLTADAWICPRNGRLFTAKSTRPHTSSPDRAPAGILCCCAALEG